MKQPSNHSLSSLIRRSLSEERGFGITEALIAVTILVIGLLAVSGLTLATALQARTADLRSDQMITGQTAIETVRRAGFAAAASGVDTVSTGGRTFYVTRTVTTINDRTKLVNVDIAAASGGPVMRDFSTVLQAPRPLPKG